MSSPPYSVDVTLEKPSAQALYVPVHIGVAGGRHQLMYVLPEDSHRSVYCV